MLQLFRHVYHGEYPTKSQIGPGNGRWGLPGPASVAAGCPGVVQQCFSAPARHLMLVLQLLGHVYEGVDRPLANHHAKLALGTAHPHKVGNRPRTPAGLYLVQGCPGRLSGPVAPCLLDMSAISRQLATSANARTLLGRQHLLHILPVSTMSSSARLDWYQMISWSHLTAGGIQKVMA